MVAISGHPATLHGIERSQGSVTIVDAVGRLRFERDGRGVAEDDGGQKRRAR